MENNNNVTRAMEMMREGLSLYLEALTLLAPLENPVKLVVIEGGRENVSDQRQD